MVVDVYLRECECCRALVVHQAGHRRWHQKFGCPCRGRQNFNPRVLVPLVTLDPPDVALIEEPVATGPTIVNPDGA